LPGISLQVHLFEAAHSDALPVYYRDARMERPVLMACTTICSGSMSVCVAARRIFLFVSIETTIRIFYDFDFTILSSGAFFDDVMTKFLVFITRHVNAFVWQNNRSDE
jgi:hypothetical protein